MLKMYIAGLTHALRLLHLVAKVRKHAENHLLHRAARAQAQGGERAYAPTPTHNPTDPPRPSSTPPTTSSDGGTSTTASCCRTRASSSPCRRAAWSPAGARSTAAPAVVWRGKGAGLRRRVLEAGDSVGSLPTPAPDAQPSQPSWSSAARKAHRGSDPLNSGHEGKIHVDPPRGVTSGVTWVVLGRATWRFEPCDSGRRRLPRVRPLCCVVITTSDRGIKD